MAAICPRWGCLKKTRRVEVEMGGIPKNKPDVIRSPRNMNTTRGAAGPPPQLLERMIWSGVWWCRVTSRVWSSSCRVPLRAASC